jgi:Uncharacterized conserved protein, contains double-stranded beta-helix domain
MDIKRAGSQPSGKGPRSILLEPCEWTRCSNRPHRRALSASALHLNRAPEQAWHSHPLGQNLIVTAGCGRVQRWGGPVEEIRPGDVIWIPPSEKHWHGAAPTPAMTHIAIQEHLEGKTADWMEPVSDEQYTA